VHVEEGTPEDVLLRQAAAHSACLIVVPAFLDDGPKALSTRANQLADRANVPVVVVRNAAAWELALQKQRPLRVLLAADLSHDGRAAAQWLKSFRRWCPYEAVAMHLYSAPREFKRLGLEGVRDYADADPVVTATMRRDFRACFVERIGLGEIEMRFEPSVGNPGERLAFFAAQDEIDLIVVGTQQRTRARELWEGSFSHGVLEAAKCAVVCVPEPQHGSSSRALGRVQTVLVATDFSSLGDSAAALAYSVVDRGGTVHLLHVLPSVYGGIEPRDIFDEREAAEDAKARSSLEDLVRSPEHGPGPSTEVHVVHSSDAAQAICQAAERLGAGLICLGTHGRKGISRALVGSVAETVLRTTKRPVLLSHGLDELVSTEASR
jgi:nucleotide-binding universal stress UspA family protein